MHPVARMTTFPAALLLAAGVLPAAPALAEPAPAPVSRSFGQPGEWTAARMRRAEANSRDLPLRQAKPRPGKVPPVAKAVVAQGHRKAPLKQIGRLYMTDAQGQVSSCTGTVVNTAYPEKGEGNGSVLLTAAHCLESPEDGWYAESVVFAPDLDRETAPHGLWNGYRALMWSPWTSRADHAYDYAFLAVARQDSGTLQKRTKGQSLRFDAKKKRMWLRAYGYAAQYSPHEKDYPEGGSVLRMCKGRTGSVVYDVGRFHTLKCNLSHGASGGPLVTGLKKSGYGRIVGVVSFGLKGGTRLHSPVFDKRTKELFFKIRKVRTPLQEAPPAQDLVRVR